MNTRHIFRLAICIINFFLLFVAGACLCVALTILSWTGSAPSFDSSFTHSNDGLAVVAYAMSSVMIIMLMFGTYGIYAYHPRSLYFYITLLFVTQTMFILVGTYIIISPEVMTRVLESLWDEAGNLGRASIQDWVGCCGFKEVMDRPTDSVSCPISTTADFFSVTTMKPCFETFQKFLGGEHYAFVVAFCYASAALEFMAIIFSVSMLVLLKREKREEGKRQARKRRHSNRISPSPVAWATAIPIASAPLYEDLKD